jgi:hypothetical protein
MLLDEADHVLAPVVGDQPVLIGVRPGGSSSSTVTSRSA